MPTYEYRCRDCGEPLEVVQSFSDDPLDTCPACGGSLRKVFGSVGIAFKGSGFYKTDSRGSGTKVSSGSSSDGGSGDSSAASSSSDSSSGGSGGSGESSAASGSGTGGDSSNGSKSGNGSGGSPAPSGATPAKGSKAEKAPA